MNAAVAIVGPCEASHAARVRDVALASGLSFAGEFPRLAPGPRGAGREVIAAATDAPWVLVVGGDEALSPELAREIASRTDAGAGSTFRIRVEMRFLGRAIGGGSFGARVEPRLVARDRLATAVDTGEAAPVLDEPLRWRPFTDLEDGLARVDRETSTIALERAGRGERARAYHLVFRPPCVLARELVVRRGLRDGLPGFMLATLVAARELILYAKLWEQGLPPELRQVPSNPPPP